MHSSKRLWTPEVRARKHLRLGPNTILAIMRHGCSILTATTSRSFIKAKLIFIVLMLSETIVESGAGQVGTRLEACGICSTDAATVTGSYPGRFLPRVPEDEVVGSVQALGRRNRRWKSV